MDQAAIQSWVNTDKVTCKISEDYSDSVVPDGIPVIVPPDLFDRVQEKMEKNKKPPARHKAEEDYPLTIKLFW